MHAAARRRDDEVAALLTRLNDGLDAIVFVLHLLRALWPLGQLGVASDRAAVEEDMMAVGGVLAVAAFNPLDQWAQARRDAGGAVLCPDPVLVEIHALEARRATDDADPGAGPITAEPLPHLRRRGPFDLKLLPGRKVRGLAAIFPDGDDSNVGAMGGLGGGEHVDLHAHRHHLAHAVRRCVHAAGGSRTASRSPARASAARTRTQRRAPHGVQQGALTGPPSAAPRVRAGPSRISGQAPCKTPCAQQPLAVVAPRGAVSGRDPRGSRKMLGRRRGPSALSRGYRESPRCESRLGDPGGPHLRASPSAPPLWFQNALQLGCGDAPFAAG